MTTSFTNDSQTGFVLADGFGVAGAGNRVDQTKVVTANLVNGAASGTFTLPSGAFMTSIAADTPVTIPGTPTTENLRVGTAAAGQQVVADVDVKTQGYIQLTLLYAGRASTGLTYFYTITPTGGTAGSQVGAVNLIVKYLAPQPTNV